MPSKLVMCVRNAIDFATITANPAMVASSSIAPSNLQLLSRARVARTTSTGSQQINFTWLGQSYYLNFLKLARHNLEPGAMWRVQLFSDANWTTQIYDSGTVAPVQWSSLSDLDWGNSLLGQGAFDAFLGQQYSIVYFNRVAALSGTITISNAGNSAGYMEASRLWAGDGYEFTWNPETASFGWDEVTEQSRSDGGTLRSDGHIAFRTLDLALTLKDEAARAKLADMLRYAGLRKDIFLSLFPGAGGEKERDFTMLCKFTGRLPKLDIDAQALDMHKTRLSFAEV